MKLTIILASKSVDANGTATGDIFTFAGPPENDKQQRELEAIFDSARRLHQFPKGVKWLGLGQVEVTDSASYINDQIAIVAAANVKREADAETAAANKRAAADKHAKALREAREQLSKTAVDWGNQRAALATARKVLEDAEVNLKATKDDVFKVQVKEASAKVSALEKSVADAEAAYNEAKESKQALENPTKK